MPTAPAKPQASAQRKATPRDHPAPEPHPARRKSSREAAAPHSPDNRRNFESRDHAKQHRPTAPQQAEQHPRSRKPPKEGGPRRTAARDPLLAKVISLTRINVPR